MSLAVKGQAALCTVKGKGEQGGLLFPLGNGEKCVTKVSAHTAFVLPLYFQSSYLFLLCGSCGLSEMHYLLKMLIFCFLHEEKDAYSEGEISFSARKYLLRLGRRSSMRRGSAKVARVSIKANVKKRSKFIAQSTARLKVATLPVRGLRKVVANELKKCENRAAPKAIEARDLLSTNHRISDHISLPPVIRFTRNELAATFSVFALIKKSKDIKKKRAQSQCGGGEGSSGPDEDDEDEIGVSYRELPEDDGNAAVFL